MNGNSINTRPRKATTRSNLPTRFNGKSSLFLYYLSLAGNYGDGARERAQRFADFYSGIPLRRLTIGSLTYSISCAR